MTTLAVLKRFLNRLPEFYKQEDANVNYKFGTVLVQEEKEIRNIISEVEVAHQIDNVGDISLDRLGKIFGLSRGAWTDDEFRVFIKSAVTGLIGGGTAPNLRTALSITVGIPEVNIKISDVAPAVFLVEIPDIYLGKKPELDTVIRKYKPVGVSYTLDVGDACKWGGTEGKWDECLWI